MARRKPRDVSGEIRAKRDFLRKQKKKPAPSGPKPKPPRREGPAKVRRLTAIEKDILKKAGIELPAVQKRLEREAAARRRRRNS